MELNFLIDEDLSLEAVLIPLLSLSLGVVLILLQLMLRLFFDRQCINDDEGMDELDNNDCDEEDNGKNE
jgi:hypothetical protein